MTQDIINKYFQEDLGRQCNSLSTTADDKVFIRYVEASNHAELLFDETITEWWEEYSGKDVGPTIRGEIVNN